MSLGVTLQTAASGLQAAQASLRAVSDNIANVNTPGYVRKAVNQSQQVVDGVGMGVRIDGVRRVTDQYLQMASLGASSDAQRWGAVSQYLDNAHLGWRPSADGFSSTAWTRSTAPPRPPTIRLDPLRSQCSATSRFLSEAGRINSQIVSLGDTVETQVTAGVQQANSLLEEISKLNLDISRATLTGADASGSQNIQSQLLDQLASLMNVRTSPRATGGVDVRSLEGVLLAGDGAATLTYNSTASTPGYITAQPAGSSNQQPIQLTSGSLKGLMDLRDEELPKLYDQLGEFVSRAVDQLNAAHNAAAAYPAPATMTGRDTSLDLPTAVNGFTGTSTIAVVDAAGIAARSPSISRPNISVNRGGGRFTPATFLANLNTALGAMGWPPSAARSRQRQRGNGLPSRARPARPAAAALLRPQPSDQDHRLHQLRHRPDANLSPTVYPRHPLSCARRRTAGRCAISHHRPPRR